ncbi:MAG: NTF2 fold immunity protein [Terracidiphilus sp.]
MKAIAVLLLVLVSFSGAQMKSSDDEAVEYARRLVVGTKPVVRTQGYLPDEATAIRIAIAVLIPIYGAKIEDAEKPWKAGLKGDVWTVVGSFNGKGEGGEAIVQLSKSKGTVLFVTHTM